MKIDINSEIRFQRQDCPPALGRELKSHLTFENPAYVRARQQGRRTHDLPQWIECFTRDIDGTVAIPRGALNLVYLMGRKHNEPIEIGMDNRVATVPKPVKPQIALRPYQQEAVALMIDGVQGYIVMCCGAGKTSTAVVVAGTLGQQTLVIVHTLDLVHQWVEAFKKVLGTQAQHWRIGEPLISQFAVATVQSLVRLCPEQLRELTKNVGCVITDESHHAPSTIFRKVLGQIAARYRFGLTATPDREDGLTPLMQLTLGDKLYSIGHEKLIKGGYLQVPEVRCVETDFEFYYASPRDHNRCMEALVADDERNQQVVDIAAKEADDGQTVLVLTGRVDHCRHLATALEERGISAKALVGTTKKRDRVQILDEFRDGRLSVLVACNIADEGLDVPRLSRAILAYPSRAKGRTIQRLGRLMRPFPGKGSPILYDMVDVNVGTLLSQHNARRRVYKQILCA